MLIDSTANPQALFTPEFQVPLQRLIAAWVSKDFSTVNDVLTGLAIRPPTAAWSPDPADLPDVRLQQMHRVWEEHRGDAELPHVSRCRLGAFGPEGAVMMILRFRPDGSDLDYVHYGETLAEHAGKNWTGFTVGELARHTPYSLIFASNYYAAALRREPCYSEAVSAPKMISTTWCRYLLPYVNDAGQVEAFACGNVPIPGLPNWAPVVGLRAKDAEHRQALDARLAIEASSQALTRAERSVQALMTHAPVALMIFTIRKGAPDHEGEGQAAIAGADEIYFANAPMAALTQRTTGQLSLMSPDAVFFNRDQFRQAMDDLAAGTVVHGVETRLRRADGSPVWTLMSVHDIEFDANPCAAFWFYDITARKEAEEALHRAQAELKKIARHDVLTGLPNRRFFYETAELEIARANRHARSLAVLLFDMDFFKKVNDGHGHAAGDEVLRTVAQHLVRDLRPNDMLARLGGEEFALLLPETGLEQAVELAEWIRATVEKLAIPYAAATLRVTASIGVAAIAPRDDGIDAALKRADDALYSAKRMGRNCVMVAAEPDAEATLETAALEQR